MNPDLLHILQHSLGCDAYGRPTPLGRIPNHDDEFGCYRNRYVTSPDSPDGLKCQTLVQQGFMIDYGPQPIAGGMHCYSVTHQGFRAMKDASPTPPRLTRGQRTYKAYCEVADVFPGGFAQFLRSPDLKRMVADYGHA